MLAVSVFNPKARLWIRGRLGWRACLMKWRNADDRVIWIHAASLGEFEQGRPLIDEIKKKNAGYKLLLTFYSPSGFEIRKNYPGADLVMYLPLDTPYNARKFLMLANPSAVVFIKYEFWHFHLREISEQKISIYLVSALFRPGQVFFRWYGGWFRKNLSYINFFFLQDESSALLLKKIGLSNFAVIGDTRFDRVAAVASAAKEIEVVRIFSEGHFCMVAGSTWPGDEDILALYINQSPEDSRFIIAPHEITTSHLNQLKLRISRPVILFSSATAGNIPGYQVLLIDNIGMLSSLYRYGSIAYVGGGFGKGIHNILEAAAFAKPIIFGPKYLKFREACELISLGGAFSIQNPVEFFEILEKLRNNPSKFLSAGRIAGDYVKKNTGATALVLSHLLDNLSPVTSKKI